MRLLVSTTQTQGQRANDFCFVPDGEIVMFGFTCDGETVDGSCGCARCMDGIETHKGTTTFKVENVKGMTRKKLVDKIAGFYRESWLCSEKEANKYAQEMAASLTYIAGKFPVGTILERREQIQERTVAA